MSNSRIRVKIRMMRMFTWIARSLLSTLLSMAMPCSVKAKGRTLEPPRSESINVFEVPIWYLKPANSLAVSTNMKSGGKRSMFRCTCRLRCLVSTP
jgi:hypothetical protein